MAQRVLAGRAWPAQVVATASNTPPVTSKVNPARLRACSTGFDETREAFLWNGVMRRVSSTYTPKGRPIGGTLDVTLDKSKLVST